MSLSIAIRVKKGPPHLVDVVVYQDAFTADGAGQNRGSQLMETYRGLSLIS